MKLSFTICLWNENSHPNIDSLCNFGAHILVGSEALQNDLVGHWKFDETSGTTAHDSSGNDYNAILFGTSNGSGSWVDGKVSGAIDLDGSNDYLAIKNLFYNQAGQIPVISISAWIKTDMTSEGAIISYDRSEYFRFSIGGGNSGKAYSSHPLMQEEVLIWTIRVIKLLIPIIGTMLR